MTLSEAERWSDVTLWAPVGSHCRDGDDGVPWPCPGLWPLNPFVPTRYAGASGTSDDAGLVGGSQVTFDVGDITLRTLDMLVSSITGTSGSITVSDTLYWQAGKFAIPTVNIPSGARAILGIAPNQPTIGTGTTFNNSGTVSWSVPDGKDPAPLLIEGTGKLKNDAVINYDVASSALAFIAADSGGNSAASGLDNLGTVNVIRGTLSIRALGVSSGRFNVSSGATLRFTASNANATPAVLHFTGPMTVDGTGRIVFHGSGGNSLETGFGVTGTGILEIRPRTIVQNDVTLAASTIEVTEDGENGGNFEGSGTATVAAGSTMNWFHGALGNGSEGNGKLAIAEGATLRYEAGSDNNGSMDLQPNASLTNNGAFTWLKERTGDLVGIVMRENSVFTNAGTFDYNRTTSNNIQYSGNTGSATFNNTGTLNVNSGTLGIYEKARLTMGPNGVINLKGGNLRMQDQDFNAGTGTVTGIGTLTAKSITFGAGFVVPGNSIGTLTFEGNTTLNPGSTLDFELGTASDKLVVTGNLVLDGTLDVSAAPGIAAGTYTLIEYSGSLTDNGLAAGRPPAGFLVRIFVDSAAKEVMVELTPGVGILSGPLGALAAFLALALLLRFRSKVAPARARLV